MFSYISFLDIANAVFYALYDWLKPILVDIVYTMVV